MSETWLHELWDGYDPHLAVTALSHLSWSAREEALIKSSLIFLSQACPISPTGAGLLPASTPSFSWCVNTLLDTQPLRPLGSKYTSCHGSWHKAVCVHVWIPQVKPKNLGHMLMETTIRGTVCTILSCFVQVSGELFFFTMTYFHHIDFKRLTSCQVFFRSVLVQPGVFSLFVRTARDALRY